MKLKIFSKKIEEIDTMPKAALIPLLCASLPENPFCSRQHHGFTVFFARISSAPKCSSRAFHGPKALDSLLRVALKSTNPCSMPWESELFGVLQLSCSPGALESLLKPKTKKFKRF